MIYRLLSRILFYRTKPGVLVLGRWGYHWDTYKDIQKYYD